MQNSPIPHQCHLTSALVDMKRFRNLSMAFLFLHLPASPSTTRPAPRVPNYPSNAQCHHNSTSIVGDSISMGSSSFCQRFKFCHVNSQSFDLLATAPGVPVVPTPLEPHLIQKVRTLYCSAGALLKPAEDMAFIKHQNKKDDSLLWWKRIHQFQSPHFILSNRISPWWKYEWRRNGHNEC